MNRDTVPGLIFLLVLAGLLLLAVRGVLSIAGMW